MPNSLAYAALLAWPLVTVWLFRALPLERALIWSILGGYLLLPQQAAFDAPLIPPLDKSSIPNLAAFLMITLGLGRKVPVFAGSPAVAVLLILFVASPVATTLLNADTFLVGPVVVEGRPPADALAHLIRQAIFLLPFFLARQFLATPAAQREILLALALGGLAYSLPMLLEIRLSPQLHIWFYGFFPHAFDQQMRFGGFRPMVFLSHGLFVAFFAFTAVVAALGLWRAERAAGGGRFLPAGAYLTGVLVLCKSVGAAVYAIVAIPLVLFAGRRPQILVAACFAAVVVTYPILRGADLIPVEAMIAQAESFDAERAESLAYRLRNEAAVLAHAHARPVFGWGGGVRNAILFDPAAPEERQVFNAILDGRWIIVISIFGWCGYIVEFGLLALPLLMLAWRTRGLPAARISPYVGPTALILGFNMFELLPNSALIPFTWLLAGAILGHAESLARSGARGADPGLADAPRAGASRPEPKIKTVL